MSDDIEVSEQVSVVGGGVFISGGWFMPDQVPKLMADLARARAMALEQAKEI